MVVKFYNRNVVHVVDVTPEAFWFRREHIQQVADVVMPAFDGLVRELRIGIDGVQVVIPCVEQENSFFWLREKQEAAKGSLRKLFEELTREGEG